MRTTDDIRRSFVDFFKKNGHMSLPSGPLVPVSDPTLLFTSAGMVPFKNVFTGQMPAPTPRAVTVQKCLRAGGKHNDLDNVGYTNRHHTFFEMLGNFSFGDYFKADAIRLAWEFVTKELGIPADRLLITVHKSDDEAAKLWRSIAGVDERRIIAIDSSDNFWQMGDTGPCGPCSEIFYDHGSELPGHPPGSGKDEGLRFVEIWNLVFMQYDRQPDGRDVPLPKPAIDTGMGLERIAAVMQSRQDNYDTDAMRALVEASAELFQTDIDGRSRIAHKVVADHLRAMSFLIAEGLLPSNEGRAYVLRRIMRRAIRYGYKLGMRTPTIYRLVPVLNRMYGGVYNEIQTSVQLIADVIEAEERRFLSLLERGLGIIDQAVAKLNPTDPIPGDVAFSLYDTYGFPLDLTVNIATEAGRKVDVVGFDQHMEQQRQRARQAWKGSGDTVQDVVLGRLADKCPASEFSGYQHQEEEAVIQALVVDGQLVDRVEGSVKKLLIVCNQTPFYPESGGQVGDRGTMITFNRGSVKVTDTQKTPNGHILHSAQWEQGKIEVGQHVKLTIDAAYRQATTMAHSATHLLLAALRRHVGGHVVQRGAHKSDGMLRFDFSHHQALENAQIEAIEAEINNAVRANMPVVTRTMALEDARSLGAQAQFGEKYGAEVRVVAMGNQEAGVDLKQAYSLELCGGTHVRRTGDIGYVKLMKESSVAAGVRRVEAVVGARAIAVAWQQQMLMERAAGILKIPAKDLLERLEDLQKQRNDLQKKLTTLETQRAVQEALETCDRAPVHARIGDVVVRVLRSRALKSADMRDLGDQLKNRRQQVTLVFSTAEEGKIGLMVVVDAALIPAVNAVDIIRLGAPLIGGKGGGGNPSVALAGGSEVQGIDRSIAAMVDALTAVLRQ